MKKKLAVFLLLTSSILTFSKGFTVKLGRSINPRVQVDYGGQDIFDNVGNLALELTGSMSEKVDIGGGIEFNNQLEKGGQKLDVGYTPIYVVFKKRFGDADATVFPYTIGRAGITLPVDYDDNDNVSVDGGIHFGGGAGIEFNNFQVEGIITFSAFETSGSDSFIDDGQTNVSKLTINFGYRFGSSYGEEKEKEKEKKKPVTKKKETAAKEAIAEEPIAEKTVETTQTTETEAITPEEEEVYDDLLNSEGEDTLSKQEYIDSKINELDQLKEQGIITEEEYQAEKQLILSEF